LSDLLNQLRIMVWDEAEEDFRAFDGTINAP